MQCWNIFKVYFKLSRPFTLILPTIGIIVSSYIANQISYQLAYSNQMEFLLYTLLGALSALLLNTASNTLNQIEDIDIDRINKPNRPLPRKEISILHAYIFTLIAYLASFILYAIAVQTRMIPLLIFVTGILLTIFYSIWPRLKRFLWIANISIALPRGFLLMMAGWGITSITYTIPDPWILGTILFFYLVGAISIKDFSDIKGDCQNEIVTMPIKYGIRHSIYIIAPFFVFPFFILGLLALLQLIYPSLIFFRGNIIALLFLACILVIWNSYIIYQLINSSIVTNSNFENHPVWRHMYGVTFVFYLGLMVCYS